LTIGPVEQSLKDIRAQEYRLCGRIKDADRSLLHNRKLFRRKRARPTTTPENEPPEYASENTALFIQMRAKMRYYTSLVKGLGEVQVGSAV